MLSYTLDPLVKNPSVILNLNRVRRESFDPKNKEHRASALTFLTTGNWGPVQFFAEFPYVTVPETVLRRLAMFHLSK